MFTQGLVTLDYLFKPCKRLGFKNLDQLKVNVDRTNRRYGGDHLVVSNLLWVNGEVDPWIANSPTKLTTEQELIGQKIIFVPGASQKRSAEDVRATSPSETAGPQRSLKLLARHFGGSRIEPSCTHIGALQLHPMLDDRCVHWRYGRRSGAFFTSMHEAGS